MNGGPTAERGRMSFELYDRIGEVYDETRREDPRIAAAIARGLGDAKSVVNVGTGSGSYEPVGLDVIAVEPSSRMIAQRPEGSARVVQAPAEALPLASKSVDAALAVQTLHHWNDLAAGLAELRRVARKRVVIFMYDPTDAPPFWLFEEYLPSLKPVELVEVRAAVANEFPNLTTTPVPIPVDCLDGFLTAFWARPGAYLDPAIRRNISAFALGDPETLSQGLAALRDDLNDGSWERRHGELRARSEMFLGHRVLRADLS